MRSIRLYAALVVLALIATALGCELAAGVGKAKLGDPKGGDGGTSYCLTVHDCPPLDTLCQVTTCNGGVCGTSDVSAATACSDNGGKQCDGNGKCVVCLSPSDCPASTTCAAVTCQQGACVTTDATAGTTCTDNQGVVCDGMGKCVAAHCADGVQDSDETDVDCGGASCSACGLTKGCKVDTDCASMGCNANTHKCDPNQCTDNMQNGAETDVDCGGGTCPACAGGKHCSMDTDCVQYFVCTGGTCTREPESNCLDGIDNNGDGLADCQDPTCLNVTVSCVPVAPVGAQLGVVAPSCPSGFGSGVPEYTGFHEGVCAGCSCNTSATCQIQAGYITNSFACSGSATNLYLTGPAGGTGSCQMLPGNAINQVYVFGVSTLSQTCTVGGSPTYSASPYWDVSTSFCPTAGTSPTCQSGQVCAPMPPSATKMCVEVPGNVACPSGYQGATTFYSGFSAGGCGGCPGTCTPGSNRCGYYTDVYGYTDNNCGGSAGTQYGPLTENLCNSISANPVLKSGNASFTLSADTCSVNQPSANVSTLNGVSTVCCM
jgi:hypothetical protein